MSGKGRMLQQKFYCQICNKQCKDENGFKCHVKTRTHLTYLEEVMKDPDSHISKHSKNFEKGFIEIIKWKYKNQFVSANKVYLEYIKDSSSSHLNATKWGNLTRFIFSMKRKGRFEVNEEGEGKFLIKLIDDESKSFLELGASKAAIKDERLTLKDAEEVKETEIQRKMFNVEDPSEISKWYSLGSSQLNKDFDEMLRRKREEDQIEITTHHLDYSANIFDGEESWVCPGLIVLVQDENLKPIKNSFGTITEISESNEFIAIVTGKDESSKEYKIEIDQYYLSPVEPNEGDDFMLLYGPLKHEKGIMRSNAEATIQGKVLTNFNLNGCCKLMN